MNAHNLHKMFCSYHEGWQELVQMHASAARLFTAYVMPMSLIPPMMFLYSMLVTPNATSPPLMPELAPGEALVVAAVFYLASLAMVAVMASLIQQMGEVIEVKPAFAEAFLLAAVAPSPLWLSSLVLFIPLTWLNVAVVTVAWAGSAALIYHGVYPLLGLEDRSKAYVMASFVLAAGVIAWIALLAVFARSLSVVIGLRG